MLHPTKPIPSKIWTNIFSGAYLNDLRALISTSSQVDEKRKLPDYIMEILTEKTTVAALQSMAEKMFGTMVKAVVDVRLKKMAVDAELHSDEESLLLESGSLQQDLWGINIYPEFEKTSTSFVEFDSMINVRPSQGNRSRSVEDAPTREKIRAVVQEWIS